MRAVTQTTHDTRHNTNHVCRVVCRVSCADLERARQECSNFGWSAPGADYVRLSEQLPRAFKPAGYDAGTSFPSSSSLRRYGWLPIVSQHWPCGCLATDYIPMETDHTRLAMMLTNHHSHGSLKVPKICFFFGFFFFLFFDVFASRMLRPLIARSWSSVPLLASSR